MLHSFWHQTWIMIKIPNGKWKRSTTTAWCSCFSLNLWSRCWHCFRFATTRGTTTRSQSQRRESNSPWMANSGRWGWTTRPWWWGSSCCCWGFYRWYKVRIVLIIWSRRRRRRTLRWSTTGLFTQPLTSRPRSASELVGMVSIIIATIVIVLMTNIIVATIVINLVADIRVSVWARRHGRRHHCQNIEIFHIAFIVSSVHTTCLRRRTWNASPASRISCRTQHLARCCWLFAS